MVTVRPNYDDCIVNLSNSLLKYFGFKPLNPTLSDVDEILAKTKPRNVVVLLWDGMGSEILDRILGERSFLGRNKLRDLHSVFPPTTTAATTSLLTGLNPAQHGWLGWDMNFRKEKKIVTMFTNTYKETETKVKGDSLAEKYFPFKTVWDTVGEKYTSYIVSKYDKSGIDYTNMNDMVDKVVNLCNAPGKKLIYAYNDEPDGSSHEYTTQSNEVKSLYRTIDQKTEQLANRLKETCLIVIADHGHITSSPIFISDYPDFETCIKGQTWIEPRACAFDVKASKKDLFEELFEEYFEKDFILYSKKQVIEKKLFGPGKEHKLFKDSLGDYLAIAIGDKYFKDNEECYIHKSHHAGITKDEMMVPLIIINK